jgi:hypothetical protein
LIYKYKLLKSSWGIVIFLDVEEIKNPDLQENDILIANNVYLRLNTFEKLPKESAAIMLSQGIRSLINLITDQLNGEAVCFHVKSLDFNYTDFQLEGLVCAIREWIFQYYKIPIEPIKVVFDSEQNRYIFDLPE